MILSQYTFRYTVAEYTFPWFPLIKKLMIVTDDPYASNVDLTHPLPILSLLNSTAILRRAEGVLPIKRLR